jgi:hypothetical protein
MSSVTGSRMLFITPESYKKNLLSQSNQSIRNQFSLINTKEINGVQTNFL